MTSKLIEKIKQVRGVAEKLGRSHAIICFEVEECDEIIEALRAAAEAIKKGGE